MSQDHQNFDFQTAIRLNVPTEMGVTLVPLESVEGAEFALFWSAIFLSLASTGLGACISLLVSSPVNTPVLVLLAVFTAIFGALTIGFAMYGFKKREQARSMQQTREGDIVQPEMKRKRAQKLAEEAIQTFRIMKDSIFSEGDSLPLRDFQKRVGMAFQLHMDIDSNDKANELVNLLRYLDIVSFKNEDSENESVHLDSSWTEERVRETFNKLTGLSNNRHSTDG